MWVRVGLDISNWPYARDIVTDLLTLHVISDEVQVDKDMGRKVRCYQIRGDGEI